MRWLNIFVDRLDVSILRELTQARSILPARLDVLYSYREIARKIGVSSGTVRNRIKSMFDEGVLLGSSVYPNPNLLGLLTFAYAVEVSHRLSKRLVIEKLRSTEGMIFIQNFHGSLLGLIFVSKDEMAAMQNVSEINALVGAQDGILSRVFYPECTSTLKDEDLKLVKRLASGSFRDYDQLAKELETSLRTVKRRIEKILRAGAILSVPTVDYHQISGSVPADLIVTFATDEAKVKSEMKILELVEEYTIFAGLWETYDMYSLMTPKVAVTQELSEQVKRMDGVKMARIEFVDEHIDQTRVLAKYIKGGEQSSATE